ncbi:tetratricopeptide repeat protein [Acidisoma sp. 7E03]
MTRRPLPFEVARARAARRAAWAAEALEAPPSHRRRYRVPLLWLLILALAAYLLQLRPAPAQDDGVAAQVADLSRRAAAGEARAQYEYGTLAYTGLGIIQDYAAAADWLRKAADQGYAAAQCELGFLYQTGSFAQGPPPPDPKQAVAWYEKAAKQNDACGAFALAALYRRGTGVEKNPVLAASLLAVATQGGLEPQPHVLPLQQLQDYFYGIAYQLTGGLTQWRDLVSAGAGGGG